MQVAFNMFGMELASLVLAAANEFFCTGIQVSAFTLSARRHPSMYAAWCGTWRPPTACVAQTPRPGLSSRV